MLALYEGAEPCVGSGFCCKKVPCPFGESKSLVDKGCIHLKEIAKQDGEQEQRYTCGIYREILKKPGWELSPAFGAGCCSSLFNPDRARIILEIRRNGGAFESIGRTDGKHS
jgi:hypothetical protein